MTKMDIHYAVCSHMAAAAIYANKGISINYLPNSWTAKPEKATKLETETVADFS